jgi:hypothetical protein
VIIEVPEQPAPAPAPPKEPVEQLEGKLKDIETIPLKGEEGETEGDS